MAEEEQVDPEVAALRDMLASEGWRLLKEQAEREWGPSGVGRRMAEAIGAVGNGPERQYELGRVAEETFTTAAAVNAIIAWPSQELRNRAPAPVSRRPFHNLRRSS